MLLFAFAFVFISFLRADLTADRLTNAQIWITRSHNLESMLLAYSDPITNDATGHTVQDVGDFEPRLIANEYDQLTVALVDIIGYAPVILGTVWDPSTTRYVTPDILRVDYVTNISSGFNLQTFQYAVVQQGFRFIEYITFLPNSSTILLGYSIQDAAAIAVFALTSSYIPPVYLCPSIVFPACNRTASDGINHLSDTGFTSIDQCIEAYSLFNDNADPCPYKQRSNTLACRILHSFSSLLLPQVHCSHLPAPTSPVCVDSCLPACNGCDVNAQCIPSFNIPTSFAPVYSCQCNNGYVGNGLTCSPLSCSYNQCPALSGSYTCSNGTCKCTDSFIHVPQSYGTNGYCSCPTSIGSIVYNASKPVCLPKGRCISDNQRYMCNIQSYTQVKCLSYGYNTFSPYKACLCNYGFTGGWEYPCSCASGSRIIWSDSLNGDVCLTPTQCTANYDCTYPKTCIFNASLVGKCV